MGLSHKYLYTIYEISENYDSYYVSLELLTKQLFDYVNEVNQYTEKTVRKILKKLTMTLSYLHANGMTFNDIQCENVFFDGENPKLCVFGPIARY